MIKLNDKVYYNDNTDRIFVVVGIREFEVEIEDDTECKWVSKGKVEQVIIDEKTDPEDWGVLYYKMDDEGFDYCFRGYSTWNEIKDFEFQKLRVQYVKAANKLENYIKEKYEESKLE